MDKKYSRMRKVIIVFVIFMGFMDNIMAQNSDYLFMIENACKAPSGHNTQPWLFKSESQKLIYTLICQKSYLSSTQVIESYLLAWGARQRIFVLLLRRKGISQMSKLSMTHLFESYLRRIRKGSLILCCSPKLQ